MPFRSSGSTDSEDSTDSEEEDVKRDPFEVSNPNADDRMEVDTGGCEIDEGPHVLTVIKTKSKLATKRKHRLHKDQTRSKGIR